MNETECQIIEECPNFICGYCSKYLDGDCSAHKCDLKIIRKLKKKLERIEDRVQDLDNYSEKNIEIMGDELYETRYCENCLELQQKLQAKEQECESPRRKIDYYIKKTTQLLDDIDNYKQALDEIEEFCIVYSSNHDAYEAVYKHILDIIHKTKESE